MPHKSWSHSRVSKALESQRRATAYHQAGHAVIACVLGYRSFGARIVPEPGAHGSASYKNPLHGGKLLESQELVTQASNNTKAQFANSPTLSKEIMNAVMDALQAHTTMSRQAIDSEKVREGLKDVLLGPVRLYEALRAKGDREMDSA